MKIKFLLMQISILLEIKFPPRVRPRIPIVHGDERYIYFGEITMPH